MIKPRGGNIQKIIIGQFALRYKSGVSDPGRHTMRLPFITIATLVPYLNAARSFGDYMRDLPVELRDEIYQYLPLRDMVQLTKGLHQEHPDILPTDHVKVKPILEKANVLEKNLTAPKLVGDMYRQRNELKKELTAAIADLLVKHSPSDQASPLGSLLLKLSFSPNDPESVGVVTAIISHWDLIDALGHLSAEVYAAVMPPFLELITSRKIHAYLDDVISDQLILDNLALFSNPEHFSVRIWKFIDNILDKDDEVTYQALLSKGESANYIISKLEERSFYGRRNNNLTVTVIGKILRRSLEADPKNMDVLAEMGNRSARVFEQIFKQNEDLLPATAAKDLLLISIKESYTHLVPVLLNSKIFGITVDHDLIYLAFKRFIQNSAYLRMGPNVLGGYKINEKSCAHHVFVSIFNKGRAAKVDMSAKDNILLVEAIRYNYDPLIRELIGFREVKAAGLTKPMKDVIKGRVYNMSFDSAELIVNTFGVGFKGVTRYMWNVNNTYLAHNRIPMILKALGLSVEEESAERE